jgi:hypothetical protein
VLGGVVALGEEAGRLDHDVDAEVTPGQGGRIALGQHLQLLAADGQRTLADLDGLREAPEDRVVLEQVAHGRGVDQVVDGDELDVGSRRVRRAEDVAPDPPETVDPDLHCH